MEKNLWEKLILAEETGKQDKDNTREKEAKESIPSTKG